MKNVTVSSVKHAIPSHAKFTPCKRCTCAIARVPDGKGTVLVESDGVAHEPLCTGTPEYRERRRLEDRLAELKAGGT